MHCVCPLSYFYVRRLLEKQIRREDHVNRIRAAKRGKKLNRFKADRENVLKFKKLEEADQNIKEREEKERNRKLKDKHLPELRKFTEGKYP